MKENFKLKLKLQHFATARVDDDGYEEGTTKGDYILLNTSKKSWIEKDITATVHNMSNIGQIEIPIVSGEAPTATELCEVGTTGTQNTRKVDLKIDKKVSEEFDGCFTVAGIADKKFEKALNTVKLKKLAEGKENTILTDLTTNATATALSMADYTNNISSFIIDMQNEYYEKTNLWPVNLFCKSSVFSQMLKERLILPTNLGDNIFVNGYKGQVMGLNVILDNTMDCEVLLTIPEAIHVGIPTDVKSIDGGILGGYENLANIDFSTGVLTKHETEKMKIAITTEVHLIFGMLTIPEFALVYKSGAVVPAPTPQQLLQEAQKEAEILKKEALEQAKLEAEKIKLEAEQLKLEAEQEAEQETKEETKNKKEK